MLAIFFLVVLFFLAVAFLNLLPLEMKAAGRQRFQAGAFYAADAGVLHALSWLEKRAKEGLDPIPGNAAFYEMGGVVDEWTWLATITPDEQTPPNGENAMRVYEIRARALIDRTVYRQVVILARQETFARFAWFEDERNPDLWIPVTLYHFDGPFHSNSKIRISVNDGFYESGAQRTFEAEVTTKDQYETPDGVQYGGLAPYDELGNPVTERYNKIYKDGRDALRTSVKEVEVPEDASPLSNAAWGSDSPLPTTPGVHVGVKATSSELSGGVYIVGDVDEMTLAVEPGGNRSVTIVQGSATTKVLEATDSPVTAPDGTPVPAGSTLVTGPSGFTVHAGTTNGVVFSTGSIAALEGVNKGKRTVGVDIAAQKEIVISGDLTRADTAVGSKPTGSRDSLGIVGYKVRVPTSIPRNRDVPLNVYAAIFAGVKDSDGGLYIDEPYDSSLGAGKLRLFGGLMQSYKPVWGTFSGSTLLSGVTLESHYDPLLGSSPPPFFPTIGKFRVMSYAEEAAD